MATLHMRVGPLIGEQLLEIAQTEIEKGNIEFGLSRYTLAFQGFTKEHALLCLKNKAVLVTDEDGEGVSLRDNLTDIEANAHNILDWKHIIKDKIIALDGLCDNLNETENTFYKYYSGDILDYSFIEMMKRYYGEDELHVMMGTANIAARICGSPNCTVAAKGSGNPADAWERLEARIETYLADINCDNEILYNIPDKWEVALYLTVRYNKLIRMLHKEYMKFESLYYFLTENEFINKVPKIEITMERVMKILTEFADDSKGYYHPLCNEGLANYKNKLYDDILTTRAGKEYCRYGLLKKDILDGYDAGWLSPEGDFYGGDGPTSSMIHQTIADEINNGSGPIADAMFKDGVSEWGSLSPDYWLEQHGWVKIHHNEIYGSFIGSKDEIPTKDFPYHYAPTQIQIDKICEYADKYCDRKLYTKPQIVKRTEPITTYKLRQMDEIMLHNIFR